METQTHGAPATLAPRAPSYPRSGYSLARPSLRASEGTCSPGTINSLCEVPSLWYFVRQP